MFCFFSLWTLYRKQQAFIERRSPEARQSPKEEPAEEEPPGASASLRTAAEETCSLTVP